ncbi:MAG: hypothetical protein WCL43_09595 [Chlorobium sp.]
MKASIKNTKQNSRKHVGGGGRTYSLMEQFNAVVGGENLMRRWFLVMMGQ